MGNEKPTDDGGDSGEIKGIRFDPDGEFLLTLRASVVNRTSIGGGEGGTFEGGGSGGDPPVFGGADGFLISIPVKLFR